MTGYLDLFTPETWRVFTARGSEITGFRISQHRTAAKVEVGDRFFCYLVRLQRWVGVIETTSTVFEDSTSYFVEGEDPFVNRFRVKPEVVLAPEYGIPIQDLWKNLDMCSGIDPQQVGWAYKVGVARSLATISPHDADFLCDELTKQSNVRRVFPLSSYEQKVVEGKRTIDLPTGQAVVEIPADDEGVSEAEAIASPPGEQRRSIRIQSRLAEIGVQLGFKIWIPANDRGGVLSVLGEQWNEHILSKLPLNADDNTVDTVKRIDVLWVRGRSIVHAFEVEDTTAVYSGILRMSDLIALQPQFQIKLHIVAPEERREKVREQILRPTFAYMEGGPLAKICTYLSFEAVEDLGSKADLRHMTDSVVQEYEEVVE